MKIQKNSRLAHMEFREAFTLELRKQGEGKGRRSQGRHPLAGGVGGEI